jgi:hypothetical protein
MWGQSPSPTGIVQKRVPKIQNPELASGNSTHRRKMITDKGHVIRIFISQAVLTFFSPLLIELDTGLQMTRDLGHYLARDNTLT